MSLLEKLIAIQNELKAPKNQRNDFGKYNYRNCEDIFNAVKPLLSKHKLLLTMNDELVLIGERYYIKATAILTDGENTISNSSYSREELTKKGMDESQITGASSSYARKYALNGLFLIDDTKDSDFTNNGKQENKTIKRKEESKPITTEQIAILSTLPNDAKEKVRTKYNKELQKLTEQEAQTTIEFAKKNGLISVENRGDVF